MPQYRSIPSRYQLGICSTLLMIPTLCSANLTSRHPGSRHGRTPSSKTLSSWHKRDDLMPLYGMPRIGRSVPCQRIATPNRVCVTSVSRFPRTGTCTQCTPSDPLLGLQAPPVIPFLSSVPTYLYICKVPTTTNHHHPNPLPSRTHPAISKRKTQETQGKEEKEEKQ